MSTTIRLSPHGEQLLREQLSTGPYRSAEGVIERALESLAQENSQRNGSAGAAKKSASEAIADMMELRKNLTLGGLKIKELINEGRRTDVPLCAGRLRNAGVVLPGRVR